MVVTLFQTLNPVFTFPKFTVKAETGKEVNNCHCHVDATTTMYWSPLIHKQILEFMEKKKQILSKLGIEGMHLLDMLKTKFAATLQSFESIITGVKSKSRNSTLTNYFFKFDKDFSLVGKLAKNHAFHFKGRKTNY